MNNMIKDIWICLCAEFLKTKRTMLRWIVIGIPLLLVLLGALVSGFKQLPPELATHPWDVLEMGIFTIYLFLFFPFFVVLISTYMTHIEHKSNTLKLLFMQPLPRGEHYLSKILFTTVLMASSGIIMSLFILLSGALVGIIKPSSGFLSNSPDFKMMAWYTFMPVFYALSIIVIHTWAGFRMSNFLLPLLLGFFAVIVSNTLAGMGKDLYYLPYAYPGMFLMMQAKPVSDVSKYIWLFNSLISLIGMILGYIDIKRMNVAE